MTDFVACFSEKLIMASIRKRKGTKTSLTTGKKSEKYRKLSQSLKLNQSLNPQQLLEQPISLEDDTDTNTTCELDQEVINEVHEHFTQAQSSQLNNSPIPITQAKRSKILTHVEKGTQHDTISKISSGSSVFTQYNVADFSGNANFNAIQAGNSLLRALQKDENFSTFALLLEEHEQTTKFVKLITALATNKMKMSNMSWKAVLDMGSLFMCTTTSKMTYDNEWLEFCQVLYHMFGGGVMNTLRGRAHFSHVTSSKSRKGYYKPVEGEFNFPIPSLPTLKNLHIGYPTDVPVGIIQHSLDLASERAKEGDEFILSFDGKLISPGCKGEDIGDCNIWGREGPPTLAKALKILQRTLKCAQNIDVDMQNRPLTVHKEFIDNLLVTSTRRIKMLRQRISGTFYLRKKLIANVGDNQELQYKYRRRMSTLNHNTAECESVVRRLLEINLSITELLSHIQRNSDVHVNPDIRHIDIAEHSNCFILLPPDIAKYTINLDEDTNTQYIKQGSTMWHEMRKKARVTGSTLGRAIGLDTLIKQKDHFHEFVIGRTPPLPTPQLQKLFDHGKKNEVNAISTLISTVLPAMLPECFAFFEVGPKFIHSQNREQLMEVSADGFIMCANGCQDCPNYAKHGDRKIIIEIKSPYPSEDIPENVYYEVPPRHVPQLLAEMEAYNSSELWLVCSIKRSCTFISVEFDEDLWNSIWNIVTELYADEKPKMPTRIHPSIRDLRMRIASFTRSNSVLMCEVPTITGEYGNVYIDPNFSSPYSPNTQRQISEINLEYITKQNKFLKIECTGSFTACHEVLRTPAKEIVVFMLTNKDRKQHKQVPYSYPIAYAMKGASMSNSDLQYMVNKLRNTLLEKEIPVLCEAYDGQWHNHITQSSNAENLTRMHGRTTWNCISRLSKDKCIERLSSHSILKTFHRNEINQLKRGFSSKIIDHLLIEQNEDGALFLSTTSRFMGQVVSLTPTSRPDLFDNGTSIFTKENTTNTPVLTQSKKRKKMQIGLQGNEQNILALLRNAPTGINEEEIDMAEDVLPDLVQNNNLEQFLLSDECPLLGNILTELQQFNPTKWNDIPLSFLYPQLLTDAQELMKMCTVKELTIIATEMRCFTGRCWYTSTYLKSENCNIIVAAFGGNKFVLPDLGRRKERIYQVDSLLTLASAAIKNELFPIQHIQIPLCTVIQRENHYNWIRKSTVPLFAPIPNESDSRIVMPHEHFSYPEFSKERNQLEPRTFDFTHILTNMRCQILTRGFDFCPKDHFEELCKDRPDILSIASVFDKIDTQNAFTAMRMFHYNVERWMKHKGYLETAKFIKLVRNWHDACNRRGLTADTRVRYLNELHVFLTHGINFNCVPFQFPDRYIRGMTWQTFEALLQNISTRIQLYYLSNNLMYNSRAVSTLSNESFFSDLVRFDKESHGYPKGVNVCKVFGRVVLINYFKHKRDRNYFLSATVKGKYEVKLAENNIRRYRQETAFNHQGLYRDHFFDFPNELQSHRVRRDDITTGLASLRTNPGVRVFFRTNEQTILPEIRGGRQVKGFTLEKNIY